jgi:DAK2 domain fusion protein YloV
MAVITRVDGILFKRSLHGAHAWLRANRDRINQLNVFPVPDGDTGTNMLLTLESALEEIAGEDATDLSRVAAQVAHGALMGARGNSGVILSQILRGFSQGVGEAVSLDCQQLAAAFQKATEVAYRGVTKPTEGTILTVARAVSRAAVARAPHTEDIAELMQIAVSAAQRAVDETPSQLAVLREAGVVDAGGYGLMVILEGFLRTVKGQPIEAVETRGRELQTEMETVAEPVRVGALALEIPEEGWGFCTEFLIENPRTGFEALRAELTPMGESAVIVGDDALARVHIHTLDPGGLIAHAATSYGTLLKLKVEDMTHQHRELLVDAPGDSGPSPLVAAAPATANGHAAHEAGLAGSPAIGVVAVAAGDGFRRIFEELGAGVVEGGQTMNPSTEDLLQAVEAVPAEAVIILPNNKNVIMSAQQVLELSRKAVAVVPTRTVPQGISALLSLDPGGDLHANAEAMSAATKNVQTIEVTRAVRSSSMNGLKIKRGDVIALVNGRITEAGEVDEEVIDRAIEGLQPDGFELLTLYGGAGVEADRLDAVADHLRGRFGHLAVEVQRGEQDHYPYILSLE